MEHFDIITAKDCHIGEFVRKIGKDGQMQSKTYTRGAYDRASKSYSLTDCDDINREVFVKASTKLAVNFTY